MKKKTTEKHFFTHDCKLNFCEHPNQYISFTQLLFLPSFIPKIILWMLLEPLWFSCIFLPLHDAHTQLQSKASTLPLFAARPQQS